MLKATEKNVEWLIVKLYELRRTLAMCDSTMNNTPTFVLLTVGEEDRRSVEDLFYRHFIKRLGKEFSRAIEPLTNTKGETYFTFPEAGCRVVLIDV